LLLKYFKFLVISIFLLNKILMPLSWVFFKFSRLNPLKKQFHYFSKQNLTSNFNFYISYIIFVYLILYFFILVALFINNISNDLNKIKSFRKIFYFIFVMFSTLTTPPDILSQLLLSFVLILNYEIPIWIKIYKRINLVTS
jgi:Sec-independent protein secretion pathway component TatC